MINRRRCRISVAPNFPVAAECILQVLAEVVDWYKGLPYEIGNEARPLKTS